MKAFYTLSFILCCGDVFSQQSEKATTYKKASGQPVDGIRIAWDYNTLKQLSPAEAKYAGYARMIKLQNGDLFCVYESDGSVYAIRSNSRGELWTKPMLLASKNKGIARAVPGSVAIA